MSARIVVIYTKPEDLDAFSSHYNDVHVPLAKKMPGLRDMEVLESKKALIGEDDVHLVTILHFDDRAALDAATASDEGQAAGRDAYKLSGGKVRLLVCETP